MKQPECRVTINPRAQVGQFMVLKIKLSSTGSRNPEENKKLFYSVNNE